MKDKKGLADFILEKNVLSTLYGKTAKQIAQEVGGLDNSIQSAMRSLVTAGHVFRETQRDGKSSVYTLCNIHWIHRTKISNQEARIFGAGNWA